MTGGSGPLIYLVAGEASGDALGAGVMAALAARTGGQARFAGVGGPLMTAQGLDSLFPMDDLAVMGLAEVLPRLPSLLRRMAQTRSDILKRRPDVLVTIDSPDFCFRVARKVKGRLPRLPIVHYVAPTVWAWRPGRAKTVAEFLDHLLCLYPFEPPYFEREGLAATFVGHPIVGSTGAAPGAAERAQAFRARHGIAPDRRILVVLPGSRGGELDRHLPVFAATLTRMRAEGWDGLAVIPTLPHHKARIEAALPDWPLGTLVVGGEDEKWGAFAAAEAALAASGTVTLELAAACLPAVVAYRVSGLSAVIARRMIKVPHVGLVNILLKEQVMPEFLQDDCRPDTLAPALMDLWNGPAARAHQQARFRDAMAKLKGPGGKPAEAAAAVIAGLVGLSPAI